MEQPKKPNALADLMAQDIVGEQLSALKQKPQPNTANTANSRYSPALQKALERFGNNKSEPLPLPGIDWKLWANMPKATLREVVAASLGIDPGAIKPRSGYAEPGKKFDDLLKLACAFVSETGPLRPIKELGHLSVWGKPEEATVSLPEFAQWALSMGYELPEKFPRFKAAPRQPATNSTAPAITATPNPIYVAIQQIVKSELQKHKPAPVVPIEPPAPPVVAGGASGSVEADKTGPVPVEQGLSTKDIAHAFDGVNGWDVERWPRNLSASKWLHPARVAIGRAGGAPSLWSPVMLAQLMHDRVKGKREKEKLMKAFNSRFTLNPALGPWRDAFNEYFATYCATD